MGKMGIVVPQSSQRAQRNPIYYLILWVVARAVGPFGFAQDFRFAPACDFGCFVGCGERPFLFGLTD